jgi:hypothetical protein
MPGNAQEHSLNARELGKNARELGKNARELGKNECQSSIFLFADWSKPCHMSTKRHVLQPSAVARTIIGGHIFIYSCSHTIKTIDFKRN